MKPPTPVDPTAWPDYQAGVDAAKRDEPRPPASKRWLRAGWDVQAEDRLFDEWLRETGG